MEKCLASRRMCKNISALQYIPIYYEVYSSPEGSSVFWSDTKILFFITKYYPRMMMDTIQCIFQSRTICRLFDNNVSTLNA